MAAGEITEVTTDTHVDHARHEAIVQISRFIEDVEGKLYFLDSRTETKKYADDATLKSKTVSQLHSEAKVAEEAKALLEEAKLG